MLIFLKKIVTGLFKKLKNKNAINEGAYSKLRALGSKLGTLYGSVKLHKPFKHGSPPFRPIF